MLWAQNKVKRDPKEAPLLKKVGASVDAKVQTLLEDSIFLNKRATVTVNTIAEFHRNEIQAAKLIGKGSFCQVREVTQFKLQKDFKCTSLEEETARETLQKGKSKKRGYVLKALDPKILKKSEKHVRDVATDLIMETKYLSRFDHPNIIKLRGMSQGTGGDAMRQGKIDDLFLLLDRLSETLQDRIQKWNLHYTSKNDRLVMLKTKYAYQVASALKYLHDQRIIYCDLKPQNIGFYSEEDGSESVRLFDFGLCVELPEQACSSRKHKGDVYSLPTSGTPRYASPEMLTDGEYNELTDVYSWAVVFYEMLSHERYMGDIPFADFTLQICMEKRPKLSPMKLPKKIEKIIKKAWEHDISSRLSMKSVCKFLLEEMESSESSDR